MKASIFLALFCMVIAADSNAQQRIQLDGPRRATADPLVLVDSLETNLKYMGIDPNSIEKIQVLKDEAAIKAYGDKGKNGVILISTRQNTVLNRLEAILTKYNVSAENRKLRVCMDKILVTDTSKLLIESNAIEGVEITTDRILNIPIEQETGEKYINIITRKPLSTRRN